MLKHSYWTDTLSSDRSVKWKTFITPKLLGKKSWNFQWMLVTCDGFCMPKLRLEDWTGRWKQNTEKTPIFKAKSTFSLLFLERAVFVCLSSFNKLNKNPGMCLELLLVIHKFHFSEKKWQFSSILQRFEWFSTLGTQDFDKNHLKLLITSLEFKSLLEIAANL